MAISLLLSLMALGMDWAQLGIPHSGSLLRLPSDCGQAGSSEGCPTHMSGAQAWEDSELGKDKSSLSLSPSLFLSHHFAWSLHHGSFQVALPWCNNSGHQSKYHKRTGQKMPNLGLL